MSSIPKRCEPEKSPALPARLVALLGALALAVACTGPAAAPAPSSPSPTAQTPTAPTPTPALTVTPTAGPAVARAAFRAANVLAHDRILSVTIGPREAGSAAYRRAADYVASTFGRFGYRVTRQRVPLPSGTSEGVAVPGATTQNVIATPPGYDPAAPHVLVGAHLDTVVPSPGANDNGTGAGTLLELARLARVEPTAVPIVWIAFGGEERRRPGADGALYGSRHHLAAMPAAERASLWMMMSIDMVGVGPEVLVCHGGRTPRTFVASLLGNARRLGIPARERVVAGLISDHGPFERAGVTVAWLWAGDHPTLHTRRDTIDIVQAAEVDRVGRVAWETLRRLRR